MERSAVHLLAKRGKSQREIARELGLSRVTVARVLKEPLDKQPAKRQRSSSVDPFAVQIKTWLKEKLTIVRMLELARADPEHAYAGGRSVFSDYVRAVRLEVERVSADVPVRFEGLPGEYLQVDWGEVRRFPFQQQKPTTRYFLACRLKHSRRLERSSSHGALSAGRSGWTKKRLSEGSASALSRSGLFPGCSSSTT